MITLSLLHPLKQIPVQVWSFEHESVIRIGRSTDNQVILYSAVVSRHHVELRRVGANWEIVNLGTNGTYLDGKRITQVPIIDGAIIRLARSGPNIQIRIGSEAAKTVANAMAGDRTIGQRIDSPPLATEITSQNEESGELKKLPAPEPEPPPPKSTIPVPPHLLIAPDAITGLPSMAGNATSTVLAAKPAQARPTTAISSSCRHQRGGKLFCADCGQPLQVLRSIGAYQLVQVLGQEEIGITYRAWRDGQQVVLKTLNHPWVGNPEAHAALECEAEILRQLNHSRLPHLIDFSTQKEPYLVMELKPGQTLAQRVASQGAVSATEAIAWMLQVCEVLTYLHAFTPPILHRDIKPPNLICGIPPNAGEIALIGFGAIKTIVLGKQLTGSKSYAAPEHLAIDATPRVDLYSLGLTLAYLLTGRDPVSFYGDRKVDSLENHRLYHFDAEALKLNPALTAVIQILTQPEPERRYPTALALAGALRRVSQGGEIA